MKGLMMMVMGSCKWVLIGTHFLGFGDEENIYYMIMCCFISMASWNSHMWDGTGWFTWYKIQTSLLLIVSSQLLALLMGYYLFCLGVQILYM